MPSILQHNRASSPVQAEHGAASHLKGLACECWCLQDLGAAPTSCRVRLGKVKRESQSLWGGDEASNPHDHGEGCSGLSWDLCWERAWGSWKRMGAAPR